MRITAPTLQLVQDAGEAVLILTEGVTQADLLNSRLTRAETCRQLKILADTLAHVPDDEPDTLRQHMPEIDWAGWRAARAALRTTGPQHDDALWFAVQSLVPATLSWLRVYRQSSPELFQRWDAGDTAAS